MRTLLTAAALVAGFAAAAADMAEVGEVVIHEPWARAAIGNAPNSVAYMTLEATGETGDRLLGGTTPVAEKVQLHATVTEDGVARMRPVEAIEVEPGAPAALEPGGLHLMLVGLEERLAEGTTFPLTLTFERAGEVELEVQVRGLNAGADHGGHGDMEHGGAATD